MISLILLTFLIIRLKMLSINMKIILVSSQLKNIWKVLTPHFPFVTKKKNTAKLITNLDNKKAVQSMDMPTKLVQEFDCLFSIFIASNVNKCINQGICVDTFKKAEIRPLHKKNGRTEKSNYRSISVLSNVSKIYERCLYDQIVLILIKYLQDINAVFVKVLAHNISF